MKGLDDIISLSVVHPTWGRTDPQDEHTGWIFKAPTDPPVSSSTGFGAFDCSDCIPDTVNGFSTIRQLYEKSNDTQGKYSVPVLWDKKTSRIVNNESADIMEMFNNMFNKWAKNPSMNLYPPEHAKTIEEFNAWIYPTINNGVYRCGFATTQEAYNIAFEELFQSLDRLEVHLSNNRYLCGDQLTSADIRTFVTLIRFDEVYVVYFKTNQHTIQEHYPNLFGYIRDIYQLPGISKSVNMKHIKMHYFTSHPKLNFYAIIPGGNPVDFKAPHGRATLNPDLIPSI
jgi:putative glutathione S-transferase